jgi:hypothetical protein
MLCVCGSLDQLVGPPPPTHPPPPLDSEKEPTHLLNTVHSAWHHHGNPTVTHSLCWAHCKALHVVATARKHLGDLWAATITVTEICRQVEAFITDSLYDL